MEVPLIGDVGSKDALTAAGQYDAGEVTEKASQAAVVEEGFVP